ncbi:MAG: Clp protease N-terminal domain-containing protein, partial [Hyphomicrobiaceae bacterium]
MGQTMAEEGGRVPMSPALQATLLRARDYAASQSQPHVLLEHLLLALTEDGDAAHVLSACSVDTVRLRSDLAGFIGDIQERAPAGSGPAISTSLTQVLKYATLAAQQGRRASIDGAIVLAALVGDGRSMAANYLKSQGLTFEAAINALRQAAMRPAGQDAEIHAGAGGGDEAEPAHDAMPPPADAASIAAAPRAASHGQTLRVEDHLAAARQRLESHTGRTSEESLRAGAGSHGAVSDTGHREVRPEADDFPSGAAAPEAAGDFAAAPASHRGNVHIAGANVGRDVDEGWPSPQMPAQGSFRGSPQDQAGDVGETTSAATRPVEPSAMRAPSPTAPARQELPIPPVSRPPVREEHRAQSPAPQVAASPAAQQPHPAPPARMPPPMTAQSGASGARPTSHEAAAEGGFRPPSLRVPPQPLGHGRMPPPIEAPRGGSGALRPPPHGQPPPQPESPSHFQGDRHPDPRQHARHPHPLPAGVRGGGVSAPPQTAPHPAIDVTDISYHWSGPLRQGRAQVLEVRIERPALAGAGSSSRSHALRGETAVARAIAAR